MKLEVGIQQRLEQRLRLAPQIIQSIEILQLPLMELQSRVEQELVENPVLEEREPSSEESPASTESGEQPSATDSTSDSADDAEVPADMPADAVHDMVEYWESVSQSQRSRRRAVSTDRDPKLEAFANTPAPSPDLREHLLVQLGVLELDADARRMAENIIANLDHNGYLAYPLEEIVASMERPVPMETAREALRTVQNMDPPGVAARDLVECLLLQLDEEDEDCDLCRELIAEHLEDLNQNRLPQAAKAVGVSIDRLKELMEKLHALNPRPASLFAGETAPYVMPDVVVVEVDGRFEVIVEDTSLPRIGFSPQYLRQLGKPGLDERTRAYLQKKLQSARQLIEAIEQRRATLQRVAATIVDYQRDFLLKGARYLQPLKMQEVADQVGVHVSTVSRAISSKWIQTPQGIYPLRDFFTGGTVTAEGEVESWDAVKQKLQDIIGQENKKKPLSDEEIARKFAADGLDVARRTITKYRKQLGIPSSRRRREY